jgi:oligosaccharide 4-alpha-D-glucosyltransferase
MKKLPLLACILVLWLIDSNAQVVTKGTWTSTPYPEGIIKLTWTFKGQKNAESFSNAVNIKPQGAAVPLVAGKKIILNKQTGITVTANGMQLEDPNWKLLVTGGFDSGHIRGLKLALPGDALWVGGGERATGLYRNGQRISLYNAPAYGYGEGQDQLNYSVPFVMSTAGYGLFFDNPAKGYIDFGKTTGGILEAAFESGRLDVFIVPGKDLNEILKRYSLLTGRQPLPPRWALGNFVSRFGYRSQQQAEDVVVQMRKDSFPMDALIIDLFWFGKTIQETLGNLDWDKDNWPQPDKMIRGFAQENINTILITEPFTIEGTKEFKSSLPHLALDSTGKPFRLTEFYFGKGGLIDLFRKPAQQWFWQFYKRETDRGVAGWWGDLGEPEHHPKAIMHNLSDLGIKRRVGANEIHNIYGHYWSGMVYENWIRDYPDKRLFFLNRAGYAGSQRYSIFPWTGDVGRNWSGYRAQMPTLQGMGLSGVPFIHSDAGGFAMTDKADPELYIRWLQFAAYTPIFRPHGSALGDLTPENTISLPSEPCFWDDDTKRKALKLIRERYRLLPYLYSTSWEHLQEGKPLMRPMILLDANNKNLQQAEDQYMWGSALLVAPVLREGETTRKLYLPEGIWYRFHDLSPEKGGQWISEPTAADRIPVFAKGGSFLPYWDKQVMQSTADYRPQDTLTIRYFPGHSEDVYTFYDDDGITPVKDTRNNGKQQFLQWQGIKSGDTLVLKAKTIYWPAGTQRVFKIQFPMQALKNYLGAGPDTKLNIELNKVQYRMQSVVHTGKKDSWANLYWTATGGDLEIRIVKMK